MKILQINKFHYNRGGAETVCFAEADLLHRHGHDVIPFSMHDPRNAPTPYERYFVSNVDLRETEGGLPGKAAAAVRILYSREAERKLARLIRDTRPDVAHLHNVYHQLSPSVLRALGKAGVPAVMTLHDYKLICPAYTLYTEGAPCERCLGGRYYNAVLHRCVKGSRARSAVCASEAYLHRWLRLDRDVVKFFIAPSEFLAQKMIKFGTDPRRLVHIPNFIEPGPDPAPGDPAPYVLYAGRVERVKGIGTLLRAVKDGAVARETELRIAGDGEARGEYEAWCRENGLANVRFLGHLPQEALKPVVEGASFVVVPSEWYENAPLSVLEAAERGKAVIASDMGGLPELVRHGATGLVFRAGDAAALRAVIEDLLSRPEAAREMGRKARALVLERHGPDTHYRQLVAAYEQAMARPGGWT
ncbi:MAG TPA: glycosyltransferase [Dehalococcoidia bacterium]|nr:glycosyltransferase [Dehalococcoidia bacterium]